MNMGFRLRLTLGIAQVYSLVSQRENALSMRDNAELKKISANQARVAVAATRDSAAMRVIAAITTVFLPATFTAVSLETGRFNGCKYQEYSGLD